jgi:FlaA1/EpsC-like NDP-sugar epimerase
VATNFYNDKRIAITGACGTVGSELVRQLLEVHHPSELICLDNNESELFFLEQRYSAYGQAFFFLADIRDGEKLAKVFRDVDIVFHVAAYKHVILCERSPLEAVQTNINGVRNVIDAAQRCNVGRVIFTSSDKAVNPTNVMGTSKLMGERLMTAANSTMRKGWGTIFTSTRFGNVLGSRGSVIPIFQRQIEKGGPVTLTNERMTRFIMSIEEAVRLVIDSAIIACGGEVFVTKMPVIRIKDLAKAMIQVLAPVYGYEPSDISIQTIGIKPGEKLYEELMSDEETVRTWELERYFSVLPAFRSMYREIAYSYPDIVSKAVPKTYHSANEAPLGIDELITFLKKNGLLKSGKPKKHPDQRYWP